VDNFWELQVDFINYDLDLATKRWDDVNRYYEMEIYRKWGELKSSLSLLEEVEGEVAAAKAKNMKVDKAGAKIQEARTLFEMEGDYAGARLAATQARNLLATP
jgi:hypothetical protein